ncbi:IPT/TIG domain-containing protein, partial [Flavobacterium hiemivividum]
MKKKYFFIILLFLSTLFSFGQTVSSFTPSSACSNSGASITINGSGFKVPTEVDDVLFNGLSATTFTVISDTEINVTLPNDATTGKITITAGAVANISVNDFAVNPLIPVSVSISSSDGNNIICASESVMFTATPTNGGDSPLYQWQVNGLNVGTPSLSNTFSTSTLQNGWVVSVVLTSNITPCPIGNPATSNSISTTVNPIPATPTASNNGPLCVGSTLNLTTPLVSGATYSWTGPNSFSSGLQNPSISGVTLATAGTYNVIVTVAGCPSAAGSTTVVVNPIPATPTASNNGPLCVGSTLNLTTPLVSGATYSWTGPNSFSSGLQNPSISGVTLATAGTYNVTVTVAGCPSAAGSTTVIVNAIPATPTASNNGQLCVGSTLNLTTPLVSGATYSWTGPNSFSSGLQNPSISGVTLATAGTYNVTVTVAGCPSAAGSTIVVVNPIPATPTASNNGPLCVGSTLNLTTPLVSGATYSWTGPNSFSSGLQNPSISGVTLATAGTYNVIVTVAGCPSAEGSTTVVVNPIPATPTASNNGPLCVGSTLNLTTPLVSGA